MSSRGIFSPSPCPANHSASSDRCRSPGRRTFFIACSTIPRFPCDGRMSSCSGRWPPNARPRRRARWFRRPGHRGGKCVSNSAFRRRCSGRSPASMPVCSSSRAAIRRCCLSRWRVPLPTSFSANGRSSLRASARAFGLRRKSSEGVAPLELEKDAPRLQGRSAGAAIWRVRWCSSAEPRAVRTAVLKRLPLSERTPSCALRLWRRFG